MQSTLLILMAIFQAVSPRPIRIGEIGSQLSADDVAAIERLSGEIGGKSWLLIAERAQMEGIWHVQVYIVPDKEKSQLRRGKMFAVMLGSTDVTRKEWHIVTANPVNYAQVALPGKEFENLRDSLDPNLPFRLFGEVSDDELISIVQFIRSGPQGPDNKMRIVSIGHDMPISSISKNSDGSFYVSLQKDRWSGLRITLVANDRGWKITKIDSWIA